MIHDQDLILPFALNNTFQQLVSYLSTYGKGCDFHSSHKKIF